MKKTRQVIIFIFEMLILGAMIVGLVYILRANIGVPQSKQNQGVDQYPPPETTLKQTQIDQFVDVYPPPPTSLPTLDEVDRTPAPISDHPFDVNEPRPTWTPFPTHTPRPTATRGPVITFEPVSIELPGSPAGEILYALRKPVTREKSRNLPPYTYIYYRQPVSAEGLTKGNSSELTLSVEAVSKLGLDTDPYGLYYSPSGKYLAVTIPVEPGELPYVIDLKTNRVIGTPFTDYGGGYFFGWHPDGEHFLYGVYSIAIWLVDAGTMEYTELVTLQRTQFIQGAAISPDGKHVTYITYNYSDRGDRLGYYLWDVSIQGSDARPLVPSGEYSYLYPESWSPDSTQIVYSGNCLAPIVEGEQPRQSLCIYDTRTGEVIYLKSSANMTTAWSPDGRYIAVSGWDLDMEPCYTRDQSAEDLACDYQAQAIYLIDLQMGENRKLISGMLPTWSPDGSMLAFLAYENGANDVWTIRIADNELRQITSDGVPKAFILQWLKEK